MSEPVRAASPLSRLLEPKTAQKLQKGFGYTTVADLLDHFPRQYMPHNELSKFSQLREGDYATFVARVVSLSERKLHSDPRRPNPRRSNPRRVVDVVVQGDEDETLTLGFFGGAEAMRRLKVATVAMFQGKVRIFRSRPTLTNPSFDVLAGPQAQPGHAGQSFHTDIGEVLPIYPATSGISSLAIMRAVHVVLDQTDFSTWLDPIPEHIVEAERLPDLRGAYEMVHRPSGPGAPTQGWHRFRFTEALLLQGLMDRRRRLAGQQQAVPAPGTAGARLTAFDAQLPFELTEGQRECGELISSDLTRASPMNRLLQGEVGSGKTLVALRAMLQVVDSRAQAALVAPTEVLARQHLRSLRRMLGGLADETRTGLLADDQAPPLKIVMLTGSQAAAERREALLDIASGAADIVIGTHSVLGETVQFAQLGLAVVDEQHRFGVAQRNALRERYSPTPHMLVMSATPIPRSVAMTAFGDLELTVLTGMPSGRSPIDTHVVPTMLGPRWDERVWERIGEEAQAGHQVYVVCPKISARQRTQEQLDRQLLHRFGMEKDDEHVSFPTARPDGTVIHIDFSRSQALEHISKDASVDVVEQRFAAHPNLRGLRSGTLHGQLPAAESAEVMGQFESGRLQVLIATTVIEVGVDVPEATLMVILDADAFGVSTLHQLRGRIGRGQTQNNQCLLVTRMPTEHPSVQRLQEVAEHTDGMALAMLDLQRRREGDVLGVSQSGGVSTLKRLRIVTDAELIDAAATHIRQLSVEDPEWRSSPSLWRAVEDWRLQHERAEDYVHQS
ncbi:ATP-dependent DNA helicase RecG [Garicola koreensis]|uniref:ATP-dependent DNA helicase RecG n=1 Tax=Garicola koreensis TaxID=1262554 RepID=A0A7W5TPN7_9MICC|nr:ATP-dependent DNA helicase RecG [Garicola koreensis]MBB3666805.1 ATP-dependent DNA helicase RecG [Garicola koreensis]